MDFILNGMIFESNGMDFIQKLNGFHIKQNGIHFKWSEFQSEMLQLRNKHKSNKTIWNHNNLKM